MCVPIEGQSESKWFIPLPVPIIIICVVCSSALGIIKLSCNEIFRKIWGWWVVKKKKKKVTEPLSCMQMYWMEKNGANNVSNNNFFIGTELHAIYEITFYLKRASNNLYVAQTVEHRPSRVKLYSRPFWDFVTISRTSAILTV